MAAFALLLRVLTPWQATAFAAAALLLNLFVLPRLARQLFRPGEVGGTRVGGIVFYPLAVLVLIVVFPHRPDIVAAAWGALAFGDGMAGLVGARLGGRRWPWNADKSMAGTAAFVVCGATGAVALSAWTRAAVTPPPSWTFSLFAPVVAVLVAALVETMSAGLDDNLSVPFSAAATLWVCSLVDSAASFAALPAVLGRMPAALLVNLAVALASHRAGSVSTSGLGAGIVVGVVIYACAGPAGWALLFAGFLLATLTSRVGLKRKTVLGIAEEREGRRGAANTVANCAVGAVAAVLAVTSAHAPLALLALTAALVAGASDTVASELGKAWGGRTFLPTTLRRVRPGTPGAMSLEGTAAGILAAGLLAVAAAGLQLVPWHWTWLVVVAATAGALVESLLAATLEASGVLDNDLLNFLNTAAAAAAAVLIAWRIPV
jgi:uncharacterized protein (TIGR00297 family)